jgi:hypothetical protein
MLKAKSFLPRQTRPFLKKSCRHGAALFAAFLAASLKPAWAQDSSSVPQSQSPSTLADSMKHPGNKQLHNFHVHGMAADGSRGTVTGALPNQEFFFVSHSLESYLIFSAMEFDGSQTDSATNQDWRVRYENVLRQTSTFYFLANQLRLLELANLDVSGGVNMVDHLKKWGQLRRDFLSPLGRPAPDDLKPALIVAWSDASDLLRWTVPSLADTSNVSVENLTVKNPIHWVWLIENPASAHANYATNHRVIEAIIKAKKSSQSQ